MKAKMKATAKFLQQHLEKVRESRAVALEALTEIPRMTRTAPPEIQGIPDWR